MHPIPTNVLVRSTGGVLLAVAALFVWGRAEAPPAQEKLVRATGVVTAWRVEGDGSIFIRIQPTQIEVIPEGEREEAEDLGEDEPSPVWFKTPPEQTETTHFEELLLDVVLASLDEKVAVRPRLTFFGGHAPGKRGKTMEEAFAIKAVGQP